MTGDDAVTRAQSIGDLTQAPPPPDLTVAQIADLPVPGLLGLDEMIAMQADVRELARQRGAVILAHNYQLPEIQEVADYVGDSLALSRQAAACEGDEIVFCGVHFMAETASVLCPDKTVLIPDTRAGCTLASSIDAAQLQDWKQQHPSGVVVMYVNTSAAVKALTDYCCTSANAVAVVSHILATHGQDTEILFGPDMWLGAYVERELGIRMHVWDGECHVHAGIRPSDIEATRAAHPGADFLIHPECGCTTSVMEYVAAGDVAAEGVHMLSTGGMLRYAEAAERDIRAQASSGSGADHGATGGAAASGAALPATTAPATTPPATKPPREAVVATEVGMLYGLQKAAPDLRLIPANAEATCAFMKMITLPRLRDSLLEGRYEVRVPADIAQRARVPIDRMVAIG